MAVKKGEMELVTIRLYTGDKDTLQSFFPNEGYNAVIRKMVNRICNQLRERANQHLETSNAATDIEADPTVAGDEPSC